jgi:signal transduction histidine kinase
MNEMLARQEHAVRSQQQFVADASHELRTPIARMRTELDTGGDPSIDNLSDDVDHLGSLVDDLLHLARADAGHDELRPRAVDLDDLVFDEVHHLRAGRAIDVDVSRVSAAHLDGDPNQLRRMVRNLLDNAARHAHSRIAVELAEVDESAVRFSVADDGDGISPEHIDQIFERFVRLDVARTRDRGGTGLGLAISRDIVRRHKGAIEVDTSTDEGTRFVVTIPT